MKIENKFPTKDIREEDLRNQISAGCQKRNPTHQSKFEVVSWSLEDRLLIPNFRWPKHGRVQRSYHI